MYQTELEQRISELEQENERLKAQNDKLNKCYKIKIGHVYPIVKDVSNYGTFYKIKIYGKSINDKKPIKKADRLVRIVDKNFNLDELQTGDNILIIDMFEDFYVNKQGITVTTNIITKCEIVRDVRNDIQEYKEMTQVPKFNDEETWF